MPRRWPAALVLALAVVAIAACGHARPGSAPTTRVPAADVSPPPSTPLLGIVGKPEKQQLARIDPATLRARPGPRVGVGSEGCASSTGGSACWGIPPWSFSPGRSLLALARHDRGMPRSLRIVDVRRMRVRADLPITGGAVGLVAWLAAERALMLQDICCDERQQLVVVDLARRRFTARRPLEGTIQRVGRTPRDLVLLLSPAKDVGPARLVVADAQGELRSVTLEPIQAGVKLISPEQHTVRMNIPGLAVDPDGGRVFVVGPHVTAEVDLDSLAVSYHEPHASTSLLARLRDWLEPPASAKGASGPVRTARWLGGGLLAVAGSDQELVGERNRIRAAGLSLLDTRDWSVHTIDRDASDVRVAGDVLLATGWSWEPSAREPDAIGLVAYGLDGHRRWRRFGGQEAWIRHVFEGHAYVDVSDARSRSISVRAVDLASGRVAHGTLSESAPSLLLAPAYSRWDD